MAKWPHHYILLNRTPIAVDLMTWAQAFEQRYKTKPDPWKIGNDDITDKCSVSTVFVFLGLDHNFGRGDPVLFETMIFGGPLDGEQWRYRSYAEAERGHQEAVAKARIACAQVKAMADNAGAKV